MGDKMKREHERTGDTTGAVYDGESNEKTYGELEMITPAGPGSGNVVGKEVKKGAKVNETHRNRIRMIGGFSEDVQKHAMDTISGNKVKVNVKFSDRSRKYEGTYSLDATVYDIIANILEDKQISDICDSETKEVIHEDTKLSTLQDKNRLDKLIAMVVKQQA